MGGRSWSRVVRNTHWADFPLLFWKDGRRGHVLATLKITLAAFERSAVAMGSTNFLLFRLFVAPLWLPSQDTQIDPDTHT